MRAAERQGALCRADLAAMEAGLSIRPGECCAHKGRISCPLVFAIAGVTATQPPCC